jgi:hypothetical protein
MPSSAPSPKYFKLTSGDTRRISSRSDLESLANKYLSTNSRIDFFSLSPSTEVIIYFKRVEISGVVSFLIFLILEFLYQLLSHPHELKFYKLLTF